jgi:alkylhydroperoxidase family enzyme
MTNVLDTTAPLVDSPPRIPFCDAEDDETRELLSRTVVRDGRPLNLFFLLAHHPALLKRWNAMGAQLLNGFLPAREREIVILRTAWLVGSEYEFGQHTLVARSVGLTDDEIVACTSDEPGTAWLPDEVDLLAMADQLFTGDDIDDGLWTRLAGRWTPADIVELIVLCGYYRLVGTFMRTTRLPREPGVPGFPSP